MKTNGKRLKWLFYNFWIYNADQSYGKLPGVKWRKRALAGPKKELPSATWLWFPSFWILRFFFFLELFLHFESTSWATGNHRTLSLTLSLCPQGHCLASILSAPYEQHNACNFPQAAAPDSSGNWLNTECLKVLSVFLFYSLPHATHLFSVVCKYKKEKKKSVFRKLGLSVISVSLQS